MPKPNVKNFTMQEMESFVLSQGWDAYRARQLTAWLYKKNVSDFARMTDLSRTLRERLEDIAAVSRFAPSETIGDPDGTRKYLFSLENGWGVESVLIPERDHYTLCVSSQVGCALGCRFCYTGTMGLVRNLQPAEILDQVLAVKEDVGEAVPVRNIVFMGMGEPLANMENMLKALDVMLDPYGLNFSHRRVTVSTAGLVPQIKRLGRENPVNLAVSLNAADDETRNVLMPINRTYPLKELMEALRTYPLVHRKRITIEYILIAGVNDADKDARKLVGLLRQIRCKINLIPLNEHPGTAFRRPSPERIDSFRTVLATNGYTAMIRESKGRKIGAACGQLGCSQAVNREP